MSQPGFTVDIYQNEHIPEGGREVNAVITVASPDTMPAGLAGPAATPGSAEIIIVDRSGSMGAPQTKIAEARRATAAAIDVIRDGVAFAVIAGSERAQPVFPPDGTMAVASPASREQAKQYVAQLRAGGGTAIGQWLRLAYQIFST